MKIIHREKGEVKIKIEDQEDLIFLNQILKKGDAVSGKTVRKIKLGSDSDREQKVIKKSLFLEIEVEKTELKEGLLRVSGKIIKEAEDVKKGTYHTFNVEEDSIININHEFAKEEFEKLKKLTQTNEANILICVSGKENSFFALARKKGYTFLGEFAGNETLNKIKEFAKKFQIDCIILASNKANVIDAGKELGPKIINANVSRIDKGAIEEVLKREEIKKAIEDKRAANEKKIIEEIKKEIAKNGLATYGFEQVENSVSSGAVKLLVISQDFINKEMEKGNYKRVEDLIKQTEEMKGEFTIIRTNKELDKISGIAALLRFRI